MGFDVNQTKFNNKFQKDIWTRGISVLPLEITLSGIDHPETREGFSQFHRFMLDLLEDMYNNFDKYKEMTYGDAERFIRKTINEKALSVVNENYPLLLESLPKFISSIEKFGPGKRWAIIQNCDFRYYSKIKSQEIDDLLYTLSDKNRICFKELHDYVITKGAKKEPNMYRYKYKNEHIISFDWKPSIFISYRLKSGNSMKSFIAEINKQPDKSELLAYLQNETSICYHCGFSTCKAYVEYFICTPRGRIRHPHFANGKAGNKIKFNGVEINPGCHYHLDDVTQSFAKDEVVMMKRLIDIRFNQIDGNSV